MGSPTEQLPRLSMTSLPRAGREVVRFGYDRSRLATGIVHLGLGAFARAHICDYTDQVLDQAFGPWGIAGVSLRSPDQRDRLKPQDWLYSTLSRTAEDDVPRIIGSVTNVLVGAEDTRGMLELLAAPATRIVSLTVTEKGYCHDPATGRLSETHADIQNDLEHPGAPRSSIGVLAAALARRRAAGLAPFTVVCCDNLPHNGALVGGVVRDFAALRDDALAQWIERNGAFPSTMVDRIVPAATSTDITEAARTIGLYDAAPVVHEPFRQWVIENKFVDDARPAWERVGAELVADVAPYENMKLRLLNASHSALAYLGYLGGHETIGDCVGDGAYRAYVQALWREEIIPVMTAPPGADLHAYVATLLTRYGNPAIRHRTWQIAMDGSQKLPQRILATVRERLARGLPIERLAHAVAAWMIYIGGVDERGQPIDVRDPLAALFRDGLPGADAAPDSRVAALLAIEPVFGRDLAANDVFRRAVTEAYRRLRSHGARQCMAALG
jgi:fructuronate reductase